VRDCEAGDTNELSKQTFPWDVCFAFHRHANRRLIPEKMFQSNCWQCCLTVMRIMETPRVGSMNVFHENNNVSGMCNTIHQIPTIRDVLPGLFSSHKSVIFLFLARYLLLFNLDRPIVVRDHHFQYTMKVICSLGP
jgi:hypothetical protein